MKLHQFDAARYSSEMARKRPRHVRLARARRPLEDDLTLLFEEGVDIVEEGDTFNVEVQDASERLKVRKIDMLRLIGFG